MSSYRDCKLYVGNLSSSATRTDLDKEFGYYGRLVNVWVARNPPGFAYVEYEDSRDARDAVRGLDGKSYMGRKLRVEVAHGMPRSRQGGWGAPNERRRPFDPNDRCYNCGESGHYAYDCALYRRSSNRRSRSRSRSRGRRSRSRSYNNRRRRSYSRSPRRSNSRSPRRSPRRSYSRSRSRTPLRSASRSPRRSPSQSRSRSRSGSRKRSASPPRRSRSRSRSQSR